MEGKCCCPHAKEYDPTNPVFDRENAELPCNSDEQIPSEDAMVAPRQANSMGKPWASPLSFALGIRYSGT